METFTLLTLGAWLPIIITAMAWSFVWKGLALWKAARQRNKGWFIVFLLINTLGILEILYIYIFSKKEGNLPPAGQSKKQEEKKS